MQGRHARTNHPPSTPGTFTERVTRRPARVALVLASAVAIAAPVVAAQPAAAPDAAHLALERSIADLEAATADAAERRTVTPGEGPVRTVGLATTIATTFSANHADDTASATSAAALAAQEAAFYAAVEREAQRKAAAEAAEAARAEEARRAEAARSQPAPAVASGSAWDRLAQCESGGNWSINTGNGYYGGLQFSLSSWRGVGGTGYPHEHSRETQIAMGERLKAQGGWGHWPACSRKLGLR